MSDRDSYFTRRVESFQVGGITRYVIPLSGAQAQSLIKYEASDEADNLTSMALVFCNCASSKDGQVLFTVDDVPVVMSSVDLDVIKAVAEKALEASGLGDDVGNG